jgi:hypothetical protein
MASDFVEVRRRPHCERTKSEGMLDRIQVLICQNLGLKEKVLCKIERHLHIADARCQSLRLICYLGRYKQRKVLGPEQVPGVPLNLRRQEEKMIDQNEQVLSGLISRM